MSEFQTGKASVIFNLLLAKDQLKPIPSEFRQFAIKINDLYKLNEKERIGDNYLRKMQLSLESAKKGSEKKIGVRNTHLDLFCQYLGYTGVTDFHESWAKIDAFLNRKHEDLQNHTVLLYASSDNDFINARLEQTFYPGQDRKIIARSYDGGCANAIELIEKASQSHELVVMCLPQEEIDEKELEKLIAFLNTIEANGNVIPIWPESSEDIESSYMTDVKFAIRAHKEFELIMQMCLEFLDEQSKSHSKETGSSQNKGVHIEGSGTVVLGNMNVEGKYISNKDMYININSRDDD